MIKLIDIVYYFHNDFNNPIQVLEKHSTSLGFSNFIKNKLDIQFIKHCNYEGQQKIDGVQYTFFKSKNSFWHIPFKTLRYIKNECPDIVIVAGLIFPLQVIALKIKVGNHCKIIVQHHGEKPSKGIKKKLQKIADRFINAYMFTSRDNAKEWVDKKIINNIAKCTEVLEASTNFSQQNKNECKLKLGLSGDINFLWVGRLNANKDPLTVLKAFEKFTISNPNAKLYMIYQTEELLWQLKNVIGKSSLLKEAIILQGKVAHNDLNCWYSAADFYISASYAESCGYSLLEAMACGCIPVVTDIPSFNKITESGKYGILYKPGRADDLYEKLLQLNTLPRKNYSDAVIHHYKKHLSYEAISKEIYQLCLQLMNE